MYLKSKVLAAAVAAALLAGPAFAACEFGERVDGVSADQARQKIEKAGYRQVRMLKKGCDSVWHGTAVQNGVQVRVLVTPQNVVMLEND
jgi:hypothetical protein